HTIAATFVQNPSLTIQASASSGGTIAPSGSVAVTCNNDQSFAIGADPCYSIADVTVDGGSVGAVGGYTFTNVTGDHTIAATFSLNSFTIDASAGTGGSIAPTGSAAAACGADADFTIAADACYSIADVTVDGSSVGAVSGYTFTNVQAAHTIAATFSLNGPYTIAASATAGGTITPSGAVSVACGATQDFAIAADAGYVVTNVVVDGASVGAVTGYTFSNVASDHTIAATFVDATAPSVTVTAPNGGENVTSGSTYAVTWTAVDGQGPIATVDLWLSMDDGATWASLASGVPNTGTYQWTVPSPGTNTGVTPVFTARIRVEAEDGGGNPSLDESDAGFSIFDPSTPTIITQLGAFSDDDGLRIQWQVAPNMVFTSLVL